MLFVTAIFTNIEMLHVRKDFDEVLVHTYRNTTVILVHPTRQPAAVVIEDHEETRRLISIILTRLGFRVFEASNGLDAIDIIGVVNPQLVTVDVDLPGMSGLEIIKRIRLLTTTSRIVVITGRTNDDEMLNGLGAGADDYVHKPFRPDALRSHIAAILGEPRTLSEAV